ncbi:KRSC protein, partial [Erpornis zantholeuca]|nr:KRSC protein [Erpornis zantholeuca]
PAASGSSHPCVVSCGASRVILFPPPVLVTFPGPILSSCPQEMVLGSSGTPRGAPGTSPRSHAEQIPHSGGF